MSVNVSSFRNDFTVHLILKRVCMCSISEHRHHICLWIMEGILFCELLQVFLFSFYVLTELSMYMF